MTLATLLNCHIFSILRQIWTAIGNYQTTKGEKVFSNFMSSITLCHSFFLLQLGTTTFLKYDVVVSSILCRCPGYARAFGPWNTGQKVANYQ